MAFMQSVDKHHRLIIGLLVLVIVFMAASCLFHDLIPICHGLFGCDHQMHMISTL